MIAWWWFGTALAQSALEVPQEFPTLQLAVIAAQPGDTIEVDAVAYARNVDQDVVVATELTIAGVNGRALLPRVVVLQDTVTLTNVRLKGVQREFVDIGRDAAVVVAGGTLVVDDATIESTVAGNVGVVGLGGDIWLERTTATNFWSQPVVEVYGGRLDVVDAAFTYVSMGAIVAHDADVSVTRGDFDLNWGELGADIQVSNLGGGSLTVVESDFDFSTATRGASIHADGADVTVDASTFADGLAWEMGGAMVVLGRPMEPVGLSVVDSQFERSFAPSGGALYLSGIGLGSIDRTTFAHASADAGGAILMSATDLTIRDSTFDGNLAFWGDGGTLSVSTDYDNPAGSRLTLEDTELAGTPGEVAAWSGGCLSAGTGATVTLIGGSLHDCNAAYGGGAIAFYGDSLTASGTEFVANQATWGGAITQSGGLLTLAGVRIEGNQATAGGAIQASGTSVEVTDSLVENNASDTNVVELLDTVGLALTRNRYCANYAGTSSAVVGVTGAEGGPFTVTNEVHLFNAANGGTSFYYGPSDWLLNQGPELWLRNNDFAGNDVAAAVTVRGMVDFRNNLLADQPLGLVIEQALGNQVAGDYNLWYQTDASQGNDGRFPAANDVVGVDPMVQAYVQGDCASNLWLQHGSPAHDAGDPTLFDPDGSRSDIGAFGGPDSSLKDADGDGWLEDLDCDDTSASVYPGAVDVPYDGVDSDCDGADVCDGDGDGFDAVACGGADCDDLDPKTFPGAADPPDDGKDQDCDDFQPRTWVNGGGGCDTTGGRAPLLALALAALATRRRAASPTARR